MVVLAILLGLCLGAIGAPTADKPQNVGLYMPEVQPKRPDTYLCHGMKMNSTETYITGFVPKANMNIAHHMLLYGCIEPGTSEKVWNCGEMAASTSDYTMAPTCAEGSKILYAWAMDAPSLKLPEDVAFEVGGNTDIKYLVLQVHYKNVESFLPPKSEKDSSGLTLITQKTKLPRRAGVYLLGTGGSIKPKSTVYMETACLFSEKIEIHPFAFRTHAHTLGKVVSGYRIRDGKWTEIGRMSPQKPQMFYNATTPNLDVHKGDILAARCTMVNDKAHTVNIGSTQNDEMCNFYIMYFVEGDKIMNENYCFSSGPPNWSWENFPDDDISLTNKPKTISTDPETSKTFEQTIDDVRRDDESLEGILEEMKPRDLNELLTELEAEEENERDLENYNYYNEY